MKLAPRNGNMDENKQYDRVTDKMKTVRAYDLNLVDRSDFIVAHLVLMLQVGKCRRNRHCCTHEKTHFY